MIINKPIKEEWNQLAKFNGWFAEPKLDGCRLLYQDGKLVRENGLVKNIQYPEVIEILSKLPSGIVLDGELCNLNNPFSANFNTLQHRITLQNKLKIKLLAKSNPATFVAFDILKNENQDFTKLPYIERIKILISVLRTNLTKTDFQRVTQIQQFSPADLVQVIPKYNMEGIILKDPNSPYQSSWIKMKAEHEIDCKVIGFTTEIRNISALELEDLDGNYVGKVNYINYPQTEEFAKKLVGMIAVVLYNMKTPEGKLRFPVLRELRKAK